MTQYPYFLCKLDSLIIKVVLTGLRQYTKIVLCIFLVFNCFLLQTTLIELSRNNEIKTNNKTKHDIMIAERWWQL